MVLFRLIFFGLMVFEGYKEEGFVGALGAVALAFFFSLDRFATSSVVKYASLSQPIPRALVAVEKPHHGVV